MTERQLKKLKREEDARVISEHEDMYSDITSSFYGQKPVKEKCRVPTWVPVLASGLAAFVCLISVSVVGITRLIDGVNGALSKGDAPAANESVGSTAPEGEPLSIFVLESILKKTSLTATGLKFKEVTVVEESEQLYSVSVDTFHTFDMLVKVDPTAPLPDGFELNNAKTATVNGFDVKYTEVRRRQEDYYSFETKAVVNTGSETYCIVYNYTSQNRECELLAMIEKYIKPRQ